MEITGILLLGLGPGEQRLLTRQAWHIINEVSEIYLRTSRHPVVGSFPEDLTIHAFDDIYDSSETFEEVYNQIVEKILYLGRRPQGVVYAVPGHPFVAEATSPEIARRARAEGVKVEVIEGLSFLEPTFSALGLDPFSNMTLVDALELTKLHVPPFSPSAGALIAQIYSPMVASEVKLTLMATYPDEHPVKLVHAVGTQNAQVEEIPLFEIDRSQSIGMMTNLYVPPLSATTSLEAFQEVIAHLRSPDGCPWDKEQTHQSLRANLLEEAYETVDALDAENIESMREELGDLLLHIVMQAQIGSELGEFNMSDVITGIHEKIVRRHPHVFGDLELKDPQGVLLNWERLKADERHANGETTRGILDNVSRSLPALMQADQYQQRISRVGFVLPETDSEIETLVERLRSGSASIEGWDLSAMLGELLFAVVSLARRFRIDPENALRQANKRLHQRVAIIEEEIAGQGRSLTDLNSQEKETLWSKAMKA